MKVFLNWSGEESRRIAAILRDWLPELLDSVEPWMAADSFGRNNHWLQINSGGFEQATMIVACVTTANLQSDWSSLDPSRLELSIAETVPELTLLLAPDIESHAAFRAIAQQYNVLTINRQGLEILAQRLNSMSERAIDNKIIVSRVDAMWPRVDAALANRQLDGHASLEANGVIGAAGEVGPPTLTSSVEPNVIDSLYSKMNEIVASIEALRNSVAPSTATTSASNPPSGKPRAFIGSSSEGKEIAEMIQLELSGKLETTVWSQGLFPPSDTAMESLYIATSKFDYAIIVMTPDDRVTKRGEDSAVPRDNLVFEAGLFGGALGRARTFIVYPDDTPIEFPSDFKGVTVIPFTRARSDGNLQAALGPACTQIRRAMGF